MRFQLIDETNRTDHFHLDANDQCAYLREYTSGQGWRGGDTNQRIANLKKRRGEGGYNYKPGAIAQCAREMAASLGREWLRTGTLVPIPPSKMRTDPDYDDRMLQVCQQIGRIVGFPVDVRNLLRQTVSTPPFHTGHRMNVADLAAIYEVDETEAMPVPTDIALVDDLITAGTHYKAAQLVLRRGFPAATISGVFWARRTIPNPFAAEE